MATGKRPDGNVFASRANEGEVLDFPSVPRGWGVTTDGKDPDGKTVTDPTNGIPPMEWFNALQKRTDEAILWLYQNALPDWAAGTWPVNATVVNAGIVWRAQKETATEPAADAGDWLALFPLANLDKRYLHADKNLSDLTDPAKAKEVLALDKVGNFVAVQQGGGIGQNVNKVYIGWKSDGKLGVTVDETDEGEFFTTKNPPTASDANAYPISGGTLNGGVVANTGNAGLAKPASAWSTASSSNMIFEALHQNNVDVVYSDFYLNGNQYFAWRVYIVGSDGATHVLEFRSDGSLRVPGALYAGGAFIQPDGNVYGTVWGGYLSNYIAGQIGAVKATGNPGAGWWRDSVTGLIIQAGTIAIQPSGSTGSASFSFPLTFPNGVVSITGNTASTASSAGYVACAAFTNVNSAGGSVLVDTNASRNMDQTQYVRYIAYGV